MKDLYTFDAYADDAAATYQLVTQTYNDIFTKLGVPFHRGVYGWSHLYIIIPT